MNAIKPALTATTLTLLAACTTLPGGSRDANSTAPLVIQTQGSFAVGGKVVSTPGSYNNNSPSAAGQTLHGDHLYAFYQVPNDPRPLPIVMLHRYGDRSDAMRLANQTNMGLTAGFYGGLDEVPWFQDNIEAGVTYANRPQGATTGAWPGYQPFGGWKGSGSTGKAIASFYYLQQYLREQSRTVVE